MKIALTSLLLVAIGSGILVSIDAAPAYGSGLTVLRWFALGFLTAILIGILPTVMFVVPIFRWAITSRLAAKLVCVFVVTISGAAGFLVSTEFGAITMICAGALIFTMFVLSHMLYRSELAGIEVDVSDETHSLDSPEKLEISSDSKCMMFPDAAI